MNDNTILAQKRKKEKKKNKKLSTYREKLVLCTYRMLITIKNFDETVFGLKKNTKCQINEKKEKLRLFQVLCKIKKTDIRFVDSY